MGARATFFKAIDINIYIINIARGTKLILLPIWLSIHPYTHLLIYKRIKLVKYR